MPVVKFRGSEQRGVQGRTSRQRFLLGMTPIEEASAGILRRGEVTDAATDFAPSVRTRAIPSKVVSLTISRAVASP